MQVLSSWSSFNIENLSETRWAFHFKGVGRRPQALQMTSDI